LKVIDTKAGVDYLSPSNGDDGKFSRGPNLRAGALRYWFRNVLIVGGEREV
jgi:hypothetical protein